VILTALVLDVEGEEAERFSDALLEAGALSVTCEEARSTEVPNLADLSGPASWPRVRLTALCGPDRNPEQVLRRACDASGVTARSHELESVPDEDWVARTRSQFAPIRVSRRLRIVPSWHAAPETDAATLVLDPGLAFGTGSHASTRLCLRWLDRRIRGGEAVLDYGCGSGILAIAALKLGARRAVGVDIDPNAVAAAKANARSNGVAGEFFETCSTPDFTADLVVANILAQPLKLLAPILANRCKRGGQIALSGLLVEQAEDVESSYVPSFAFEPPETEEGWVCLSGMKR
jgi:ribosomal protein L11 methyltransferase